VTHEGRTMTFAVWRTLVGWYWEVRDDGVAIAEGREKTHELAEGRVRQTFQECNFPIDEAEFRRSIRDLD
jgi:hypothetical protein